MVFGILRRLGYEKKSQDTIATSQQLYNLLVAGGASKSGVTVNTDSAMRVSTVYACVKLISESLALLPFQMYKNLGEGKGKQRDTGHWANRLFADAPNEWQTPYDWFCLSMACLLLRGNAYSFKNRNRAGEVVELLPIHPNRVKVEQDEYFRLWFTVTDTHGSQRRYSAEDIFHLRGFSLDGVTGLSTIDYARNAIGLGIAVEEHASGFWKNGTLASGVITHPAALSDEAQERIKGSWREKAGGLGNSHETMVLEEGMKFEAISMSNRDSQFIEERKFQRSDICAFFRVPPHKIGDLERATNNNIEHQGREFVTDTLMPHVKNFESAIRKQILGEQDRRTYYGKFNLDAFLRPDLKTRYEAYQVGINNGIISPNEARAKEDMNPREGGDEYQTPLNMRLTGEGSSSQEEDEDGA